MSEILHQDADANNTTAMDKTSAFFLWEQSQAETNHLMIYPFPKQALVFTCLQCMSFENTAGKEEIAHNNQFLLFSECFLPIWITFCHFHQIWNCRLQILSVWKSLKFVVLERVKYSKSISVIIDNLNLED